MVHGKKTTGVSPGEPVRSPEPTSARPSRRSLLGRLWLILCGAVVLELTWIGTSFFRPKRATETEKDIVVAGPVERFVTGSVTAFPQGRFYLARLSDGGFLALSRTCTHLGCTVPWVESEQRFVCPCHASTFDITGAVSGSPAPRPLDLHPVRIENGIVKVEAGLTVTRGAFSPDQVTRT